MVLIGCMNDENHQISEVFGWISKKCMVMIELLMIARVKVYVYSFSRMFTWIWNLYFVQKPFHSLLFNSLFNFESLRTNQNVRQLSIFIFTICMETDKLCFNSVALCWILQFVWMFESIDMIKAIFSILSKNTWPYIAYPVRKRVFDNPYEPKWQNLQQF